MWLIDRNLEVLSKSHKERKFASMVYYGSNKVMHIFGYMHGFFIILTANMTYTRSQNYTNTVVGKHDIQH